MAQILVRNIEDDVVDRLRRRAKAKGLSLEEAVRQTLREAARPSREDVIKEIDRIRTNFIPGDFDSLTELRKLRNGDDDDR